MGVLLLLTIGSLIGGLACDQTYPGQQAPQATHYPTQEAPLGYPIEGGDTALTAAGNYYSSYPSGGGQYDYGLQLSDTDRQDSIFTFPMVLTAFLSAMMGGLLAPLVVGMAARVGDMELPVLPDIEVPDFPIKRVNKKKKTKKGRELDDSIVNMLQSGLDRILDH